MKMLKIKKNKITNVPRRTFVFFNLILLIFFSFSSSLLQAEVYYPVLNAKSNLLMNAETGVIYISDSIDEQLGIASLTKLMSIYVVLENFEEKNTDLTQKIPLSIKVRDFKNQSPDISGVYFNTEEESIEKLLNLALVYSDNAATIALAEYTSGTEEKHVEKMNKKAEELGMKQTIFYNVTGLTMKDYGIYQLNNTKKTDFNKSSSRDLAVLSYNLLMDFPDVLDITSKENIDYDGYTYNTYNLMLPEQIYGMEGIKGLKTGTTNEAGQCFISYYEKEGQKYISVVLGLDNEIEGTNRFLETIKMYDWIEQQTKIKIIKKDDSLKKIEIKGSTNETIDLYSRNDIDILKSDLVYLSLIKEELNSEYFTNDKILKKTIPKGTTIMTLTYEIPKNNSTFQTIFNSGNDITIELISKEEIKKQNKIFKIGSAIKYFIKDLY